MAKTRTDRRLEEPVLRTLVIGSGEVRLLGGEDEVRQTVPGMDHSLESRLWELSRARKRSDPNLHQILLDTGAALSERYLVEEVAQALARDVADAEGWGVPLELGIRVEDPGLTSLPWETLRVQGPDGILGPPLSLHPNVHLYRSVKSPRPVTDINIPGPLRILVAIGSPEEQNERGELLDYEAELDRILESVDSARRKGEAHIRILHRGTVKAIQEALEVERFHVLYISCHAGPGVLLLEDEDGQEDRVDTKRFVAHLPEGLRPPLVVLAGCATALGRWEKHLSKSEEAGGKPPPASYLPGLAESLLRRGVPAVLAMQDSVGDVYARSLGQRLFHSLAKWQVKEPLHALTAARRVLEEKRRENPDRWEQAEWATPSLYLPETGPGTRPSRPLFSADQRTWKKIEEVAEPTFAEGVVHRREGFVGRRREERLARKALLGDKKSGVLIHGLGGVGKSTLAAELLARLRGDHLIVSVYKETQPDSLLAAVGDQLLQFAVNSGLPPNHPFRELSGLLRRQDLPWEQRFNLLRGNVLANVPLLLLVDNFEDNLVGLDDGWEVKNPHLAQLLASWLQQPGQSRLLITSRHPFSLPDGAESRLERFHLGPLSLAETRKLFWRLPQLDALDREQQENAYAVVGGHPRTLEYLDALLAGGEARFPDVEEKLRKTLKEAGEKPEAWLAKTKGNLDQALAEVVTVAVQDVVLEDLLARLDDHPLARKLLFRASVYRLPVDSVGLAWQAGNEVEVEEDPEREERRRDFNERAREARKEGTELTAENLGYSEREWQQLKEDERQLFAPPLEDVPKELGPAVDQLLELGLLAPGGEDRFIVHRWTADALGRLDQTGEVGEGHQRAARYWRWRVKVVPQDRMEAVQQLLEARWHHREAGETDEAIEVTGTVVNQLDTWGAYPWEARLCHEVLEWVPGESAQAARSLLRLGNIATKQGSYKLALAEYRKALAICEELEDCSGIAASYHQLGIVSQHQGSYAEASSCYLRAMEIFQELGDLRHVAASQHQLGRVLELQGSYQEALAQYRASLDIRDALGDLPGLADSYHHLGVVAHACDEYDEALYWYRRSMEIEEKLGNRFGMATSYHQLGLVAERLGSLNEALSWHRKAVRIREDLGDRSGLAGSYLRLGTVSQLRGMPDEAESWYQRSLEIFEELETPVGVATSCNQLGMVTVESGKPEEGVPWHLRALDLFMDLESPEVPKTLFWLTREEDLLGQDRFQGILDEHLDEESRDAVLGLMEEYRQIKQETEAEAGGVEGAG